jgi:hypothetical protein
VSRRVERGDWSWRHKPGCVGAVDGPDSLTEAEERRAAGGQGAGSFVEPSGGSAHHLSPELLEYAVKLTVDDRGIEPAVILLHNP